MNKAIDTNFACYVSFTETLQTWWKTRGLKLVKFALIGSLHPYFPLWLTCGSLEEGSRAGRKGGGKKGGGRIKMKMKTEGGVLPHIIIYMEEKICLQSARAQ
jgi:hypothetical protein